MKSKRVKKGESQRLNTQKHPVDFSLSAGDGSIDGVTFSFSRTVRDKYEHTPNLQNSCNSLSENMPQETRIELYFYVRIISRQVDKKIDIC